MRCLSAWLVSSGTSCPQCRAPFKFVKPALGRQATFVAPDGSLALDEQVSLALYTGCVQDDVAKIEEALAAGASPVSCFATGGTLESPLTAAAESKCVHVGPRAPRAATHSRSSNALLLLLLLLRP